jgi:hypothetical protein
MKKLNKKLAEIESRFFGGHYVYSKYRLVEEICLFISRWSYRLTTGLYLDIKYKLQDWFRGYNDLDKWNVAWYLARKAIPVLKAMRDEVKGTSLVWHREDRFGNITELTHDEVFKDKEEPQSFTEEEWKNVLTDIIFVFEYTLDIDKVNVEYSEEQEVNRRKRYKRGLKLFSIYYGNLWD